MILKHTWIDCIWFLVTAQILTNLPFSRCAIINTQKILAENIKVLFKIQFHMGLKNHYMILVKHNNIFYTYPQDKLCLSLGILKSVKVSLTLYFFSLQDLVAASNWCVVSWTYLLDWRFYLQTFPQCERWEQHLHDCRLVQNWQLFLYFCLRVQWSYWFNNYFVSFQMLWRFWKK